MVAPSLIIRLDRSIRLAMTLSLAHFFAIGILWPLMLPMAAKLIGTVILAASLIFYLRHYALLRSPGSVVSLELSDEMVCTLETRHGERIPCMLLGSSFVAPYLAVLDWKPMELRASLLPWQRFPARSVVILPDGIDAEEFRQLRVLLRWKWKDAKNAD
ncbi:protein YgfX [Nitrosospira sp. Nl5]|uniref:protein YgfX n=1 Tax=Nitrosospira sp. Nl5 TaxID=200120 RepID=UPI0015A0A08D|nr:protein YgfX [Nitrosospira sp. Nl5]